MLASILHHNNIPCSVFERDSSSITREQGGTLDLHECSGQRALDAAGLLDKFRCLVREGGEAIKSMSLNASRSHLTKSSHAMLT
jgi:hypothetical protein